MDTGVTKQSQFVKYFQLNAHRLQFRKLIATCLVERAAGEGEALETVQNCYVLERVTVPADQRNIWGYSHGMGRDNPVIGEKEDFVMKYETKYGYTHPVPYHIVNQAVTDSAGRIRLVKKFIETYDEQTGQPVMGDEFTGRYWNFQGHQLTIKWCREHPDGQIEMLPDECYFYNNGDFFDDLSVFPKDKDGNPCYEDTDGGSVCLAPPEYYDYVESDYVEYSMHCPADSKWGSGDFRSEYCTKLLAESDVVVTNPPFSIFREFIAWLIPSKKKFLIIGNMNCIVMKELFPLVQNRSFKVGFNIKEGTRKGNSMAYLSPQDGGLKDIQTWWFHNFDGLDSAGKHDKSEYLCKSDWEYRGVVYRKYDNYNAIEVPSESRIPIDYDGIMGVPATALRFLDLGLWQIIWQGSGNTRASAPTEVLSQLGYVKHDSDRGGACMIDGKLLYSRLFIKRCDID